MNPLPTTPELSPYLGGAVDVVTAPNGARVSKKALDNLEAWAETMPPGPLKIAEGVWQIVGESIVSPVVIEGDDGLIVYDTGESLEEGERYLAAIRKLSAKPVKAIVYSHAHYAAGTAALVAGQEPMVIGHPDLNANLTEGGLGSYFPELAPLQRARTAAQFHMFLPKEGADAPVIGAIHLGRSGFRPVTRPVQDGEEMTVAGVRMQFFTRYGSDTDDCLTVWLPDLKIALNNLFWPMMPNIYTPRGAKFRDPREWAAGLKVIRGLQPEVLLSTHAKPVHGKEEVAQALTLYMDGLNFILDQTLRGALKGLGPDELREFVRLPEHLAAFPNLAETYGELSWYAPYIYQYALGWFTGDAASLNPLPPQLEAQKIVAGFGGRDPVLAQARQARDQGEYAWAAQLANYLYRLDPLDADVRQLKAEVFRAMAQVTPATLSRSYYLTHAGALEGRIKVPIQVLPSAAEIRSQDPGTFVDQWRVRIDPKRSAKIDAMLRIEFDDMAGGAYGLHVRRGVAEFIPEPDGYPREPDHVVQVDRETWARIFRGEMAVGQALASGKLRGRGDAAQVERFFDLFDQFDPRANLLVPPVHP